MRYAGGMTKRDQRCGGVLAWWASLLVSLVMTSVALAGPPRVETALVLGPTGRGGRQIVSADALGARLVAGTLVRPEAGSAVVLADGSSRSWRAIELDGEGWARARELAGGWLWLTLRSDDERVWLLRLTGHGGVLVNGEPRAGDPYANGSVILPVLVRAGENEVLVRGARGDVRVGWEQPRSAVALEPTDATLPDAVVGRASGEMWAGVRVVNASAEWARGVRVRAEVDGRAVETAVAALAPLSTFKAPVRLPRIATGEVGERRVRLTVVGAEAGGTEVGVRVRGPGEVRRVTFVSGIDGSVQYYALREASGGAEGSGAGESPGIILTLHGASVEATNQAEAYTAKSWAHVVAPTNRRPFGFDWEDWGRVDAMEVLEEARRTLGVGAGAPVWLTGHSMGGHGTWIIGSQHGGMFRAIGPSAGWSTFWSYGGGPRPEASDAVGEVLLRASNASDTMLLTRNLAGRGVYVLHGDADDNVPVTQARGMLRALSEFHADLAYYERPGAGHWWGNECVDWPPMMAFFRERARAMPGEDRVVRLVTVDPSIASRRAWVGVLAQVRALAPSEAEAGIEGRAGERIVLRTSNVRAVEVDVEAARAAAGSSSAARVIVADGTEVSVEGNGVVTLVREGEGWARAAEWPAGLKGPQRGSRFREVFGRRVVLVVGTRGGPDERAWSLARARFDAETFWYRGNGALEIVTDLEFLEGDFSGRSVVLYGDSEGNAAWGPLLEGSPISVEPGVVTVGDRRLEGTDLAVMFVRPRPGCAVSRVGVIAGTGPIGRRLVDRTAVFLSGSHTPDWVVVGPEAMRIGLGGVRAAGFFAYDWTLGEDAVFREAPAEGGR